MIGLVVAGVLSTCLLVYCFKNAYKRPHPNFPPGPPSFPVLGAYPIVKLLDWNNLAMSFLKLSKIYKTKLLGAILANVPTVTVHDPKLIKDFLNEEQFDGRMDIILFRLRSYWKKLGIFFTDGYFWHTQRRFSLRFMRDYGFGRRSDTLEETVQNEIKEMIDMTINGPKYPAEKELVKGDLVHLPHYFAVPFINGMCHVFARMTLPRSEYHVLWDLARSALVFQRNSDDMGGFLSLQPWVKDVFPKWSGFKGLTEGNQYMLDFFGPQQKVEMTKELAKQKLRETTELLKLAELQHDVQESAELQIQSKMQRLIDEVMATQDDSYDRHFLDMYIKKMKEEQKTKEKTTYSVEQLRLICTDYMFPAASATEAVLTMLMERLLLNPEIQDKIHEEIDRVVGRDRMPTLNDRKDLPYTEAVLREAMRWDTLVPLGVPHRAMKDMHFGGYDIPEGTLVAANYLTLHMDKDTWGDPEVFRPERFLENGKLNVALDKSLPFGAGRRLCAGETYARQTMFQVLTNFMQRFHVSTADGKPLKTPAPRQSGIITNIPDFWIRVTPRS